MSIDDTEALIAHLAGPLSPHVRADFRRAAEEALARLPCAGAGSAYRAISALQREYFDPPTFGRTSWNIDKQRPSKLKDGPPLHNRKRG